MGSTRNRRPWRILKGTKAEQRQGNRTNNLLLPALVCDFVSRVKINLRRFDLKLAHRWAIARSVQAGGSGGTDIYKVVFVELTDADGTTGIGEAAPSPRYEENADSAFVFLERVNPARLSFADVPGSMKYLDSIAPQNFAAKGAISIALFDGAARRAGKPIYAFLGLDFAERKHITSFSIGIDKPEVIRRKVLEAAPYPVLKLKVGGPDDKQNLAALRAVAKKKPVRVDANEGWKTKEDALRQIEWLAADGHVQFVEQPMPATTDPKDLIWLKNRSPLPIMADESYLSAKDIDCCAECYHAVNVKLVKAGGIAGAYEALQAARKAGLKTMIGCMIESSVLITAAAHLAELADHLDLDGNLLVTNDPYLGATAERGIISFAQAPDKTGLGVRAGFRC
ncbi:MAG: dipeptide epimerase [Verrucomicrobia bacterium]|nr:MAG: dipeptide epimerase [Verrucomicrobiota bacterium]